MKENHWAVPLAHLNITSDSNAHSCYLVMKRKHPLSCLRKGDGMPQELLRRVDTWIGTWSSAVLHVLEEVLWTNTAGRNRSRLTGGCYCTANGLNTHYTSSAISTVPGMLMNLLLRHCHLSWASSINPRLSWRSSWVPFWFSSFTFLRKLLSGS